MRGLDIRIMLAHERVWAKINGHTCGTAIDEYTFGSYGEARCLGYSDTRRGYAQPPVFFRDEPTLLAGWSDGVESFEDEREMHYCTDGCNDGTGNPCPVHG